MGWVGPHDLCCSVFHILSRSLFHQSSARYLDGSVVCATPEVPKDQPRALSLTAYFMVWPSFSSNGVPEPVNQLERPSFLNQFWHCPMPTRPALAV